jgi:hypothetical protein
MHTFQWKLAIYSNRILIRAIHLSFYSSTWLNAHLSLQLTKLVEQNTSQKYSFVMSFSITSSTAHFLSKCSKLSKTAFLRTIHLLWLSPPRHQLHTFFPNAQNSRKQHSSELFICYDFLHHVINCTLFFQMRKTIEINISQHYSFVKSCYNSP